MKGDFTRFTHRPAKQYAGVLLQQGRVQLDADWNEQVEIQDQRWRTQTVDMIGACGVPDHAPGYGIELTSDLSDLVISPGRIYVDGLLHELPDGTEHRYLDQPDLPDPPPLNPPDTPGAQRTDLVYLDVWRRHITAVEDDYLREVALGGPDTATRLQTVAQVKVLQDVGDIGCGDEQEDWTELVARSPGRLTAQAVEVEDPGNPCLIVPEPGIRGLENRLYRVEIHDPGPLGVATFVWSRDNGSVVTRVVDFVAGSSNQVVVASLGRDQATRFREEDRVEVLSDTTELAGTHGTLARVIDVDTAGSILTLSADVSAHANQDNRRVRRWDQPSDPVPTSTTPVELDPGITVKFSAGAFQTGDFWLIPARAAIGGIEELTDAPPRGIDHHFCRLALIRWQVDAQGKASAETPTDCRKRFPPLTELDTGGACCTVTVGDGETSTGDFRDLQAAVDSLEQGGRVCVLPGDHQLAGTVTVGTDGIVLSGCQGRTRILAPTGLAALKLEGAEDLAVEGLTIQGGAPEGTVLVDGCTRLSVRACEVANTGQGGRALVVTGGVEVEVTGCRLAGQTALSMQAQRSRVAGNHVLGGGIWLRDGTADVRVDDNQVGDGVGPGIALGGLDTGEQPSDQATGVARVAVTGNRIADMDGSGIATVALDADDGLAGTRDLVVAGNQIRGCARQPADPRFDAEAVGGITLRDVAGVRIHDNLVVGNGGAVPACGVFVHTCQGLRIEANTVTGNGAATLPELGGGYQAGIAAILVVGGPDDGAAAIHGNLVGSPRGQALVAVGIGPIAVTDNTLGCDALGGQPLDEAELGGAVYVLDLGGDPTLSEATVSFAAPAGIHLQSCRSPEGVFATPAVPAEPGLPDGRVLFQGNQVTLRVPQAGIDPPTAAVAVLSLDDVAVLGNQVRAEIGDGLLWADMVAAAATVRVAGNRFSETRCRTLLSCLSSGILNSTTANQATHCIEAVGSQVDEDGNQVVLAADCRALRSAISLRRG
jgi:Family of unknown function (DUF6519)/Right handed beta helix region